MRALAVGWSALFAAFAVLCAAAGIYFVRHAQPLPPPAHGKGHIPESDWVPVWCDYLLWLHVAHIRDENDNPLLRNTDWVLVARDPAALDRAEIRQRAKPIPPIPGLKPWSDDFNNLFAMLK